LAFLTNSSLIRKQNFLACYYNARKEALSAKIIKVSQNILCVGHVPGHVLG
jgi:hypothetical protein